jgi:hypothetical protein
VPYQCRGGALGSYEPLRSIYNPSLRITDRAFQGSGPPHLRGERRHAFQQEAGRGLRRRFLGATLAVRQPFARCAGGRPQARYVTDAFRHRCLANHHRQPAERRRGAGRWQDQRRHPLRAPHSRQGGIDRRQHHRRRGRRARQGQGGDPRQPRHSSGQRARGERDLPQAVLHRGGRDLRRPFAHSREPADSRADRPARGSCRDEGGREAQRPPQSKRCLGPTRQQGCRSVGEDSCGGDRGRVLVGRGLVGVSGSWRRAWPARRRRGRCRARACRRSRPSPRPSGSTTRGCAGSRRNCPCSS